MSQPTRTVAALFTVKFDTEALKRGDKMINRATQSLKILGGTVGAGLVVRGLTNFTANMAQTFDTVAKGARSVEFGTRAFQEWQHVIALAGGSATAFSKYVFTLQRAIGEAARGTATYRDALNDLGLSSVELRKLSPQKQFETVFDALSSLEDQTRRNAIAQILLGRGARDLSVAFQEGSASRKAAIAELERLGGVIDRRTLKSAERFQDKLEVLNKAFRGLKARVFDALLPSAEKITHWITEAVGKFNQLAKSSYVVESALLVLQAALAAIAIKMVIAFWPVAAAVAALAALILVVDDVKVALAGGKSVIDEFLQSFLGISIPEIVQFWADAFRDLREAIASVGDWWDGTGSAIFSRIADTIKMVFGPLFKVLTYVPRTLLSEIRHKIDPRADTLAGAVSNRLAPQSPIPFLPKGSSPSLQPINTTHNENNITVNGASGDPKETARRIAHELDSLALRNSANGYR